MMKKKKNFFQIIQTKSTKYLMKKVMNLKKQNNILFIFMTQ